jgi:aldehyde:ferredoxin oxidoreductase
VAIKNGEHLRGKTVWETDRILKEEIGDEDAKVIAIGPAGENLIASAITIGDLHRAAGGCGTGAVIGSKNLKGIVVRGTKGTTIAKPEKLKEAFEKNHKKLVNGPLYKDWSKYGSSMLTGLFKATGLLPTFNWQQLPIENVENVDGPTLLEKYHIKHVGCIGCAVHCDHYYLIASGPYSGTRGAGVEYEALNGYGPRAGGTNLEAILYINNLLNQLGLDVVQTANWINTIMHWRQDGLIDKSDIDNLPLEWGNYDAIIEAIKRIAYRNGPFANAIADNIFSFAEKNKQKEGNTSRKANLLHNTR